MKITTSDPHYDICTENYVHISLPIMQQAENVHVK